MNCGIESKSGSLSAIACMELTMALWTIMVILTIEMLPQIHLV